MSNLVMGVAVGYTVEQLEPFVLSLRKHYKDDCVLFVGTIPSNDIFKDFDVPK